MKIRLLLCTSLMLILCSCSDVEREVFQEVLVEPTQVFQVIEGFGASDCWAGQFIGENWPDDKKEAIADLLFSKETDTNGNPIGIGLSHWRFNIGAGTNEQGDNSEIPNPWRRAECFLNSDGTYNWNKQAGQQWFLRAAKKRGVEKLLAFTNSAPVLMTKNNKGWSPGGNSYNITPDKMDDYAVFLSNICKYFQQQGLNFDYISPFNEPQWDWKSPATQEGSPATNADISQIVRLLSNKLNQDSLNTKIVIPEAAKLQFLYDSGRSKDRDKQITALFDPHSTECVGNLSNVESAAVGHSYFTTANLDTLIQVRSDLQKFLSEQAMNLTYWQSEYCILEKHADIGAGHSRDLGMATALFVARVIHADLALANAALWSWWTAISPLDYKDGLIYLDRGDEDPQGKYNQALLQKDGFYRDSKLLWAFGNFSRFIQPGMVRIQAKLNNSWSLKEQLEKVMLSGYKNIDDNNYVFVAVNYSQLVEKISFNKFFKQNHIDRETIETYTTSETMNLRKKMAKKSAIHLPPRSVVTIVIKK